MKYLTENTDDTILVELGERLAAARLARNLRQDELADLTGLSKRTVERMEMGRPVQLSNFVRALRGLGLLANLELLVPETAPSPLAQLKLQRRERKRASSPRERVSARATWAWNEDKA
jgi:transcriptional regulator with XRE-family HTH domain